MYLQIGGYVSLLCLSTFSNVMLHDYSRPNPSINSPRNNLRLTYGTASSLLHGYLSETISVRGWRQCTRPSTGLDDILPGLLT